MQPTNDSAIAPPSPASSRPAALDLAHVGAVKDDLLAALAVGSIRLDLSEVASCDLAGLQLLWAANASAGAQGHRFTIVAPSPAVLAAATIYGLDLGELQDPS